jgi:hypothetical protein
MDDGSPSTEPTELPSLRPPPRRTPAVELCALLSAIICLAQELIASLPTLPHVDIARRFGTLDFKLIMARITRALMMAEALDNHVARFAKRIDNPRPPRTNTSKSARASAKRPRFSWEKDNAALLAGLPTAAEIAEQIRRRPIAAVLADICRDLGLAAEDRAYYRIMEEVVSRRGSLRKMNDWAPAGRGGRYAPKLPHISRPKYRRLAPNMTFAFVGQHFVATGWPVPERATTGPP